MATVRKRGNTYQIRVSAGYDFKGNQIIKSKTWKPSPTMTERQIKKELETQTVLFEQQVQNGQFLDGNITVSEFIERWFKEYAESQLKVRTLQSYKDLIPRITQALGHIKLCKLQPHHLMEFYNNLTESGIRLDTKYKAVPNLKEIVTAAGYTQKSLSAAANIGVSTIRACYEGRNISKDTVNKLSAALNRKDIFQPVNSNNTLADTTIVKYHRILSSILTTAVQWQVIPSNPCNRVKPPHVEYKEAPVLDELQLDNLINCLDNEPFEYKTAIMLVIYTGMRRGELCGLNWSDIDFERNLVHITKAILYTPEQGIFEDTPKSRQSSRAINIPQEMITLLKQWKIEQCKQKLLLGDQWKNADKVFTSSNGDVMRPDSLTSWFQRFIKRNNLPNAHLHTLRHVSATLLIAGGVDVATVSSRLGHANKSTTLNIYTHAIKSADAAAANLLQDMLHPQKRYQNEH